MLENFTQLTCSEQHRVETFGGIEMNEDEFEQLLEQESNNPDRAMRFNKGKPQLSYLMDFPNAMLAFTAVCEMGAQKYARHNWKKGMPVSQLVDSLLRHTMDFYRGEDVDKESGIIHAAHMMWNCAAIIETLARHPAETDDRDISELTQSEELSAVMKLNKKEAEKRSQVNGTNRQE